MKIEFKNNNGELHISLEGRLDTGTAPGFEEFINEKIAGASSLIIDCSALEYISSAGLRVLLYAHKKMQGAMKLTDVCELVMEVFDITGFSDILVIE